MAKGESQVHGAAPCITDLLHGLCQLWHRLKAPVSEAHSSKF